MNDLKFSNIIFFVVLTSILCISVIMITILFANERNPTDKYSKHTDCFNSKLVEVTADKSIEVYHYITYYVKDGIFVADLYDCSGNFITTVRTKKDNIRFIIIN